MHNKIRYSAMGVGTRQGVATLALAAIMYVPFAGIAQAQTEDYPSQPLTLVVPFAPGGSTDLVGRLVAEGLSESLGQPVAVDNRAGGGGITATVYTLNRPADGYTLLLSVSSKVSIRDLQPDVPYDPLQELTTLSPIASVPTVLVAPESLGLSSIEDLKEHIANSDSPVSWGSSGVGNAPHIATTILLEELGVEAQHIAYGGSAMLHPDLLEGRIAFTMDNAPAIMPHIESGGVTPLAVASHERLTELPDVPTLAELGYDLFGEYLFTGWNSVDIHADANPEIKELLSNAIGELLQDEAFIEEVERLGMITFGAHSLEEAEDFTQGNAEIMSRVLADLDLEED